MTAIRREVGGKEIEQKGKKDSWTWATLWRLWGEGAISDLNVNGKNTIKIKIKEC